MMYTPRSMFELRPQIVHRPAGSGEGVCKAGIVRYGWSTYYRDKND